MNAARNLAGDRNDHGSGGSDKERTLRDHGKLSGTENDDNSQSCEHKRCCCLNDISDSSQRGKRSDKEAGDGCHRIIADEQHDQRNQRTGNEDDQCQWK